MKDSAIYSIPEEVMVLIFWRLNRTDQKKCTTVSRRFHEILYSSPCLWKRLVLSNELSLGGEKQYNLNDVRRKFDSNTVIDDGVNRQLFAMLVDSVSSKNRFSLLSRLELSYTNISLEIFSEPSIIESLGSTLTHLYVDGCFNVDSGSLYYLNPLKALVLLDISHCSQVDDFGLEVIAHAIPHVQYLNLSYLFRLTEKGISRLFKLKNLLSVNLLGCYRIRSYPWALTDSVDKKNNVLCPIKELNLGEDARIQTGGFWLLWCCWNWNMKSIVTTCPFLETLRINMVLFDLPADGIQILLDGCKSLKNLGLVVDRNSAPALCQNSEKLNKLETLELTCHIGLAADQMTLLIESKCLKKLTALKFHSKHTLVFSDDNLLKFSRSNPSLLEYFEFNAENISEEGLNSIVEIGNQKPEMKKLKVVNADVDNNNELLSSSDSLTEIIDRLEIHRLSISSNTTAVNDSELNSKEVPLLLKAKENPKLLQNVLIHNATMTNNTFSVLSKGLKNCRELTLSNLQESDSFNRLSKLVGVENNRSTTTKPKEALKRNNESPLTFTLLKTPACISKNLRKIEISSIKGFSDKDLSSIPANCTALQWIEFSFCFTFPETLNSITANCKQLLYLKLFRFGKNSLPSRGLGGLVGIIQPTPRVTTNNNLVLPDTQGNRGSKDKAKQTAAERDEFLASSKECRSFVEFGKKGPRTLRMMDFSGNIGVTDWTLVQIGLNIGDALHTIFLESCSQVTRKGLLEFSEIRWKWLKRINIRNCLNVKFSCVDENFLVKGLEVETILDGSRLGTQTNLRSLYTVDVV